MTVRHDPVRVLVADDDPEFRSALAELIEQEPTLELVGLAADADEALRLAELQPDVVLIDVRMPGGGGPAVARELDRVAPGAVALAFSAYDDAATVLEMLDAGAVGYLLKGASVTEIVAGLRRGAGGQRVFSDDLERLEEERPAPAGEPVTVLVADDNADYLDALAHLIAGDDGLATVGKAMDVEQAVRLAALYRPDVALLDVEMGAGGGADAARKIRTVSPDTRCVALSFHTDPTVVLDMLRAGAMSYIVKTVSGNELLSVVHRSAEGVASLSPEITSPLIEELTVKLPDTGSEGAQRRDDRTRITRIVRERDLTMVFQPILDVGDGTLIGMEALARFGGDASRTPDVWFGDAAAFGLGVELELLAADLAAEQLPLLPEPACLFINLSPEALCSSELEALVATVPAKRIVVEVTEHARVDDYAALDRAIDRLRSLGGRLAVDDVGAGFAIQHLLELNPEVLKLDLSLCRSIDADPARRFLARGLVSFAHDIGAKIIAEGIETPEELGALGDLGIPWAQGFYLGKPTQLDRAGGAVPTASGRA
jgi:DNA-binding NarL/FixJ family response regulator/EAL domain-containing protein (putative c-di-GMP-specific phosphodiesterase class I)